MGFFRKKANGKAGKLQSRSVATLLAFLSEQFNIAIKDLNNTFQDDEMKLSVTKPFKTTEKPAGVKNGETVRLSVSNAHVVLSIRAFDGGSLEAFLLPAAQFVLVPSSEYPSRLRFKLEWGEEEKAWMLDGRTISENDLRLLILASTNDILKYSQSKLEIPKQGARLHIGEYSLTTGLRDLFFEKAQLIADLLSQQEVMQAHVAQELHDSVIADLLFLRRELSSGKEIELNKVCESLDQVIHSLRELCTDFSTNDLRNWGLLDAIGALLERLSERSGIEIVLEKKQALPKLPQDVSLQVYRMVQESVNNAVKHSQATLIRVCANCSGSELNFVIEDNGIGFELNKQAIGQAHKRGGMGMPILKERAERLSALGFPSTIKIESRAGSGTKILVQLDISQQSSITNSDPAPSDC